MENTGRKKDGGCRIEKGHERREIAGGEQGGYKRGREYRREERRVQERE